MSRLWPCAPPTARTLLYMHARLNAGLFDGLKKLSPREFFVDTDDSEHSSSSAIFVVIIIEITDDQLSLIDEPFVEVMVEMDDA